MENPLLIRVIRELDFPFVTIRAHENLFLWMAPWSCECVLAVHSLHCGYTFPILLYDCAVSLKIMPIGHADGIAKLDLK